MKLYRNLFIFVTILACILSIFYYFNFSKKSEAHTIRNPIKKPILADTPKDKPLDKKINPPLIEIVPNKNEAPMIDGIKSRTATVSLKDELYTEELVLDREKVTSMTPVPVRPKQAFIKWVMQFSASVAGAIAVKENKLYFGTYDYQVFSLNAESGEVIHQTKTVSQPINSTHIYKDLFLVPQRNGQVTAYSTLDGKEKWNHRSAVDKPQTEIDLSISGINVFGNKFYVSKHWGNLYIVNADTGVLEQDVGVTYESRINLPAIKTTDGVLFSNVAGEIHCFKDDGTENWHYTLPKGYALSMQLVGNTLFIATTEKELLALNLKDRSIFWTKELAGLAFDSMKYINSVLFVQAKNIYAFEPSIGKVLWQIQAVSEEGFCRGAPIITNENLYAIEQSGRLICAGLNDGAVTKNFEFKEIVRNPITFEKDLIYISTTNKRIYAMDVNGLK